MDLKLKPYLLNPKNPWLLVILASILLFGFLGERSLWGSEGRWSEAARWMLLSGDYLTPRLNGGPWLAKPPLSYWVILPFSWNGVSEFSSRVPSVLGGILAIYGLLTLSKMWNLGKAGVLACVVLLTTFLFVFWARTAAGDMPTVGCATLAAVFIERFRGTPRAKYLYQLALLCAMASQVKGLLGVALPWVTLISFVLADLGRPRKASWPLYKSELIRLWCRGHLLGSGLLFLGLYLTPFILERVLLGHWESLNQAYLHTVQRALGNLDHTDKGPFFYCYYIFILALPWSLWIIPGLFTAKRKTVFWTLGIFLFFTASSSRRSYYLLPILPPCALIIAEAYLSLGWEKVWSKVVRFAMPALLLFASVVALPSLFFLETLTRDLLAPGSLPALPLSVFTFLVLGVSSFLALRAERNCDKERSALFLSVGLLTGFFFAFWIVIPSLEQDRSLRRFARSATKTVKRTDSLSLFGRKRAAAMFFYLDRKKPIPIAQDAEAVALCTGYLLIRPCDYPPLLQDKKWKRQIAPAFEVILRERDSASADKFGPCKRCQRRSRRRGCKHYMLLRRLPIPQNN